ncbi:MAG: ABC-type transport auxiliary lipoprotein family protein [Pseudomonadota bacterium]
MMRFFFISLMALALTGCFRSDTLIAAPEVKVSERVSTSFRTIEVLEVSLPDYATGDEIALENDSSLSLSRAIWADDPTRAVTLGLSRNLTEITGRSVAPEPWPFDERAAARVDVRVEQMLVSGGQMRMSGQFFVTDLEGRGRDRAKLFDLTVPMETVNAQSAAEGRAKLVAALASRIAKDGL